RPGCPNDNAPIEAWFSNLKGWFKSRYGDWYNYSFGEIIQKIHGFRLYFSFFSLLYISCTLSLTRAGMLTLSLSK
ncbi:MAG: hypothetical protein Q8807_03215, partial ['Waltheria sp.' little leaf phytoplasma]|nr:hypothetical protein ['Waltheria sp.' little leaf phytoplasma]